MIPFLSSGTKVKNSDIKSKLLRPALTSNFTCNIKAPEEAHNFILKYYCPSLNVVDHITIPCSETTLPGSSIATHELNNDFTGVTQRHAYRALYDDRVDFTFYVGHDYMQLRYFEGWKRWIINEQQANKNNTDSFRVRYPEKYKSDIMITAEARDGNGKIDYTFIDAFPISIASMPVSYDSSQLLKCTVSFSYDRYILGQYGAPSSSEKSSSVVQGQTAATGVPNSSPPAPPPAPAAPPAAPPAPPAPIPPPPAPPIPPPPPPAPVESQETSRDRPILTLDNSNSGPTLTLF